MEKTLLEETEQKTPPHKVMIRYAERLSEVYQRMEEIIDEIKSTNKNKRPLLWFRGHARSHYNLQPSLYRDIDKKDSASGNYTTTHTREEYRFQHFMARNYDNLTYRMPQSFIEWQEIMQHYGAKTRLMDWSESLNIALEFALEDFFKPVRNLAVENSCCISDPAIWIVRPDKLNEAVYDTFMGNTSLISRALQIYAPDEKLAETIRCELKNTQKSGLYYSLQKEGEQNMNVVSLSSLELLRSAYKGRELRALENQEINPYFFLLLRYYSDGLPIEYDTLPPLPIIHPYHSERIKIQKGVFMVFPHYLPNQRLKDHLENASIAMEYMRQCIPWLYKIQILDPKRVAEELMMTGTKRGGLYPEMQSITEDMENVVPY